MERQFYKMIRVWRCRVSSVEVFGKPEVNRKTVITAKLAEQYWLKIVLQGKLEAQKTITISNFTSAHAFPVKPEIIGFKPKEGKYQVYFESNPRNQTHGVQKWDPFFSPPTHFRSKPAIIGFWLLKDNNGLFCIQTNLIELADSKNDHEFCPTHAFPVKNENYQFFVICDYPSFEINFWFEVWVGYNFRLEIVVVRPRKGRDTIVQRFEVIIFYISYVIAFY